MYEKTFTANSIKLIEAAELLFETIGDGEIPSRELDRLSSESGISIPTLKRAKAVIGVKARKVSKSWVMYIPPENRANAKETIAYHKNIAKFRKKKAISRHETYPISTDWTKIVIDEDVSTGAIDANTGLHIKVGSYEFTADANYPLDKLAELLRGLDGDVR
jgi:hypothetical protein